MKAANLAALFATLLILTLLADACAHQVPPSPKHISRMAYTLGEDAEPNDLFCVLNLPGPLMLPNEVGLHCTNVLAIRKFVSSQQFADH